MANYACDWLKLLISFNLKELTIVWVTKTRSERYVINEQQLTKIKSIFFMSHYLYKEKLRIKIKQNFNLNKYFDPHKDDYH